MIYVKARNIQEIFLFEGMTAIERTKLRYRVRYR